MHKLRLYWWRCAFSLSPSPLSFHFRSHFDLYCDLYCGLFVLPIHPDLFDYIMSQVPDDLSTSSQNFQIIFVDALKQYKKRTRKDIASHTLAAQIKSCDSPDAVLTVLQTQVQTFDPSPSATKRWTSLFDPTITVLYAFSTFVSDIVGPVN